MPAQELLNFKDEELRLLTEKVKKMEFEMQNHECHNCHKRFDEEHEEKIQVLSKEIQRLTELSNHQNIDLEKTVKENQEIKYELDLLIAKMHGLELENKELKITQEKLFLEKKTVEVEKIFIKDNAEFNEKLKQLTLEINDLHAHLEEKTVMVKRLELEKIEVFKSNQTLLADVEHWRRESMRFEAEIREILLRMRAKDVELEDFRSRSHLQYTQINDQRLIGMQEEIFHWKSAYEFLFFQEMPRLKEALMHAETFINSQPPPPMHQPMIRETFITSQPPPPPPMHQTMMSHDDEHCKHIEKIKELRVIIERLEKEIHERTNNQHFHHDDEHCKHIEKIKEMRIIIERLEKEIHERTNTQHSHHDDQNCIHIAKIKELIRVIEDKESHIREFEKKIVIMQNEIREIRTIDKNSGDLDRIIANKDQEIRSLRIQIDEKNSIINNLKSHTSNFDQHTNNIHISSVVGSSESLKIEIMKLQKLLKEKNQEIQTLRLQVESFERKIKIQINSSEDDRVSLLEKELELWKQRFSENMIINMKVKQETIEDHTFREKPMVVHERQVLRENNSTTTFYEEKIKYYKVQLENKEQEVALWKRKYEDLIEAYRRLEISFEREVGRVVSRDKEVVFGEGIEKRPTQYVVEVDREDQFKEDFRTENFEIQREYNARNDDHHIHRDYYTVPNFNSREGLNTQKGIESHYHQICYKNDDDRRNYEVPHEHYAGNDFQHNFDDRRNLEVEHEHYGGKFDVKKQGEYQHNKDFNMRYEKIKEYDDFQKNAEKKKDLKRDFEDKKAATTQKIDSNLGKKMVPDRKIESFHDKKGGVTTKGKLQKVHKPSV